MSHSRLEPVVLLKRLFDDDEEEDILLSKPLKAIKLEAPAKREAVEADSNLKDTLQRLCKTQETSTNTSTNCSPVPSVSTTESGSETDVDPDAAVVSTRKEEEEKEKEVICLLSDDDEAFDSDEDTVIASSRALSTEESSTTDVSPSRTVTIETPDGKKTFKLLQGFDTFWKYASERHAIEEKRRQGKPQPWTKDRILASQKFTSVFRVADSGSQFLITHVIEKGSQAHQDILFRVLVYSSFMKNETYKLLEHKLGPLTWRRYKVNEYDTVLQQALDEGQTIYTGAFQKFAPKLGARKSHLNHLWLLEAMIGDNMLVQLENCQYMADAFDVIYKYPGSGDFIAFQLLMNLSYTPILNFGENDFVVAGVGACEGLKKCFAPLSSRHGSANFHESGPGLIRWIMETQSTHFERLGLKPAVLGAEKRRMTLVDVEHTLCEMHKYTRASAKGAAPKGGRFTPRSRHMPRYPFLPKVWKDGGRESVKVKPGRKDRERAAKVYVIARIVEREEDEDGEEMFLVDWLGYSSSERTWEPGRAIREDAPRAIEDFERRLEEVNAAREVNVIDVDNLEMIKLKGNMPKTGTKSEVKMLEDASEEDRPPPRKRSREC